jgi:hypothetical protein
MAGAEAATEALKHQSGLAVTSLQAMHAELRTAGTPAAELH